MFAERHPKTGDAVMNAQIFTLSVVLVFGMDIRASGQVQPKWFADAVQSNCTAYRQALTNILIVQDAAKQLEDILKTETAGSTNALQARILLARQYHPHVFADYEELIKKMRKDYPHGERPGFLSGTLLRFTKQGPENKYVDEKIGRKTWQDVGPATNKVVWSDAVYKKTEKYTDAEVQAGIARNAAARQAVLEHFLKFLDDGDAYEQSEMVELVNRLWGRERIKRTKDLAVVDNVPDVDDLIESVYKDDSRSLFVRYTAALCLPKEKQGDLQGFMLTVVAKSMSADFFQSDDLLNRTLSNLESSADAAALAALKSQTNGPKWKVDAVIKTTRKIEARLSKGDRKEKE